MRQARQHIRHLDRGRSRAQPRAKLLVLLGRTNMSMPMPLVRVLEPFSMPSMMAAIDRISDHFDGRRQMR